MPRRRTNGMVDDKRTTLLLDLGENGLEGVLISKVLDVRSLGRLMCANKFFADTLSDPVFLRRLTAAHGFSAPDPTRLSDDDGDDNSDDDGDDNSTATAPLFFSGALVDSLAVLDVMSSIKADIKSNHIVFHLASLKMVKLSKNLLAQYAQLMQRHPRLLMRIDSHTGVGAPPPIAPQHSVQRACVVAKYLADLGIGLERITACAWGMDVGRARR